MRWPCLIAAALPLVLMCSSQLHAECKSGQALAPGDHNYTVDFEGVTHNLIVHIPPSYNGKTPLPLLLDIHGFSSDGAQQLFFSGSPDVADRRGFIVVAPTGYIGSWNGDIPFGEAYARMLNDVGFMKHLVGFVAELANIDHSRVYATGSLGDGPNMVEWAVAGASHNDKRLTEASFEIVGEAAGFTENPIKCMNPMNDFPAYRVYNAVLDWIGRWVRSGERPPMGTPFETSGNGFALDEHMNVRGGVWLPDIDVPIKSYINSNGPMDALDLIGLLACGLAGSAQPFTPAKLLELYPTHEDYVQKYTAAANEALTGGYLLKDDYDEMVEAARAAPIPN